MKKKIIVLLMITSMLMATACSKNSSDAGNSEKILKLGCSYDISSMDPQKDWNGWYTSESGVTETLFKIDDDYNLVPWLAKKGESDGNTWTITLKDGITFSNGDKVEADDVVASLKRAAQLNDRAVALAAADIKAVDENTLTITTQEFYPTMLNDLSDPYTSIVDTENTTDYDKGVIGTGPFAIQSVDFSSKAVLVKNKNYWDGDVKLDKAEIYYIQDADTMTLSMQNGEIDTYIGPTAAALETYKADKDTYTVTSKTQSRVYMYYINLKRITDEPVRKAINMAINDKDICSLIGNMASSTDGAFNPDTAYGKVDTVQYDPDGAKALLEAAGYTLNSEGYYEKDGKVLSVVLAYYPKRSLDQISTLMQEQLKNIGIKAELRSSEDADAGYFADGEYDLGMYSIVANSAGDPYSYLKNAMGTGGSYNFGGFSNSKADEYLSQMELVTDMDTRADLANKIQQIAMDENAYGFIAILNKITIAKNGVSNIGENNPTDFYILNADSNIK